MPERKILLSKRNYEKNELRTHCIMIRLNASEFSAVSSKAKQCHQPLAVYVRNTILRSPTFIPYQICVDIGDIKPLVTEYSRIGNNLNQIAKYFHTGGAKSQEMEFEIRRCITQLFQLRSQIMNIGDAFSLREVHFSSIYSNKT